MNTEVNNPKEVHTYVCNHRCFSHPIFEHWTAAGPDHETVGALFHQIQSFCASTRPGLNFTKALSKYGFEKEAVLQDEIVRSESGHGQELAKMAGHIVNRTAKQSIFSDLENVEQIENKLKEYSDKLIGNLPGYDRKTGLSLQTRRAIEVFERRAQDDYHTTLQNIGVTLALEVISNQHLIPGEKACLLDSQVYDAHIEEPEMHYLATHWGELGAEQQHEENAFQILERVWNDDTRPYIMKGVNDFLNSLASMWDFLSATLLHSGYPRHYAAQA